LTRNLRDLSRLFRGRFEVPKTGPCTGSSARRRGHMHRPALTRGRTVRFLCEHMFVSAHPEKRCSRCRELKPASEFAWHRRGLERRQAYCRSCHAAYRRAHYLANRERHIAAAKRWREALVKERTEFLGAFFRRHPCVDCGQTDPVVLEFDHLGEKAFDISSGIRARNWRAVIAEIGKCEVVCANCHRRRTAVRGGFARAVAAGAVRLCVEERDDD